MFKLVERKGTLQVDVHIEFSLDAIINVVPASAQIAQLTRDNGTHHLTVLTPSEATDRNIFAIHASLREISLDMIGIGCCKGQFYIIISSPQIQLARYHCGLPWKDLHVTIGITGKDLHDVDKGPRSLCSKLIIPDCDIIKCLNSNWIAYIKLRRFGSIC